MHANNEVGTLQPIAQVAALTQEVGAWFHVDAVQTLGMSDWTVDDLGADLVNLSAHKLYGPKGTGALYLRAGVKIAPLVMGGGQEREMRAGTENVAGIVGFVPPSNWSNRNPPPARDAFEAALEGATFTLRPETPRLAGHSHLRFPGISAETMLIRLDRMGVAAQQRRRLQLRQPRTQPRLASHGWTLEDAKQGLRFTFGAGQDADLGREAAARVNEAVAAIRATR